MGKGTLKQNGVHLQEHEYATVRLLLDNGFDVELIPPSQIKGFHIADIMVQGLPWEIKSPQGSGKKTIENNIQNAAQQSENVIIDLRRCKLPQEKAIREVEYHLKSSKRIRHIKVITRDEKILDFIK